MSDGSFLHCRDCDVLFRPSPYDRAREFQRTPDGYIEIARDDCMAFLVDHSRHVLHTLRLTGSPAVHEGPHWDPMVATYWQVTDGVETFLIRGSRERLEEPLRYQLLEDRLAEEPVSVEIPEEEIRERLDATLYPGVVTERRLRSFVEAFREIAWDVAPEELEPLYDVPCDRTLTVACLPTWARERLMRTVRRIFDTDDVSRIELLVMGDDEPDALHVLVRRQIHLEA